MSNIETFSEAVSALRRLIQSPTTPYKQMCNNNKVLIQDSYKYFATNFYNKSFLNWGLWDPKIFQEFMQLDYDFSPLCPYQDIHSPLLIYYIIRPLVQQQFFNKRIVEIGCGNGIGIKMASHLLKADFALGVDLVSQLAQNAKNNFYEQNKVNYIQGDSERLGLESNSFDVVTNIESSHLYPTIELFFSEVARILKPGGFFCYTDIHLPTRLQDERMDAFLKSRQDLRLIHKIDITKLVQAAIYNRLMVREHFFYEQCTLSFGTDPDVLLQQGYHLARSMGLLFLPWWRLWPKTKFMKNIIKMLNKTTYRPFDKKKFYYYYFIQKIE